MEWLAFKLGLGEGELEFVDVGVPMFMYLSWSGSSLSGGDDANTGPAALKNFHLTH